MGKTLSCKLWAELVSCLCRGCGWRTAQASMCLDVSPRSQPPGGTRSTAHQDYVMRRLSENLGFLPGFGRNRDSVTPRLPAPVRLRSRRGGRGVAAFYHVTICEPACRARRQSPPD